MTEYEIIADPQDYGIEAMVEGLGGNTIDFPAEERQKWAIEVGTFAERLLTLSDKAQGLQTWLDGTHAIKATPASLKTLKIQFFKINGALESSLELVDRLEADIVPAIKQTN
ncbi:MAG: hypothetical protein JJV98_19390 [Desulfosarcina sp.]|nr:hypothetical protein [Desulfobacterales bacterium]